MKLNPRQVVDAATGPRGKVFGVLLFGPDQGLISETAGRLVAAVAGKPANPFLLTEISAAQLKTDPAAVADEMMSLPMMGDRKVIHIRQATDAAAAMLDEALQADGAVNLLVVEAGELPPRSKLRKAFEAAASGAAVGCYGDDRGDLEAVIREVMTAHGVTIEPDAVAELLGRIGNDRMVSRGEIEKLALYAGDGGQVTAADVLHLIGDSAAMSVDEVVFGAADGLTAEADQALARALGDGVSAVQVLRAFQRHFQRLHAVGGEVAKGAGLDQALGRLRPPMFFKYKSRFQRQCRIWSLDRLTDAMALVTDAERQCKQTGAPDAAICQRAVLRIAATARRQAGR